jgi:alpha-beta hydrolase superfamily lysophospholipase
MGEPVVPGHSMGGLIAYRTTTEALVPPPRIQRHRNFGVLVRTAASGQIGWRGRVSPSGR